MNLLKRIICAMRGHGGISMNANGFHGTCKKCGATVDLRPRQWRTP